MMPAITLIQGPVGEEHLTELHRVRFSTSDKNLLEATLNYAKKFGKHDVSVLGGYSYEDYYYQAAFAQNRYFVTNLFGPNNLGAGEQLLTGDVTSTARMSKLISFFGRVKLFIC